MADRILFWLTSTLAATGVEALVVGGGLLAFGLLLYCLERRTLEVTSQAFGVKAVVIVTGWIGTTVHELSHALLCVIFRHKITEISLFSPDTESGVLGYVRHGWDKKSLYQNLGLLFIGIAPLLVGSALLVALGYLLLHGFGGVVERAASMPRFEDAPGFGSYAGWLWGVTRETLTTLFVPDQLRRWQLWVFLYVSVSVSCHLAPSPADLKGAWLGLALLLALALLANGTLVALGQHPQDLLFQSGRWLGIGAGLMTLAVLLSGVNFLVSWLVSALWSWARGEGWIWPV